MDPGHRGWPPQHSGNAHEQNQAQSQRPTFSGQQSPPQAPSGLPPPPPSGPFPHFHQQPPSLANLAGISQSSPRQPPPPTHRPDDRQQGPLQGPQLPLPGFSQATGQPGAAERERERARHEEQIHIKEEEDRRHRELERHRLEQAPPHQPQPGPPMPLHQPVAVGPRSVHGPNGLLSNPAPQPQMPLGAPSGPGNIFAGGPVQAPPQAQQSQGGQQIQQSMLMPFPPNQQPPAVQQQQQQVAHQQAQATQQGGQQPILNDALSYLDQVKVQFADHPDVYNRFLDIMKDFKSANIDTPGVIGRVSTLFAGNPDLIQGFNTFLPPGYRIECGVDAGDPNSIRVTTPAGTTINNVRPGSQQEGDQNGMRLVESGRFTPQQQQAHSAQMIYSPSGRAVGPGMPGQPGQQHLSPMEAVRQHEQQQAMAQQQERGVNSLQSAVSAATAGAGVRAGVSPRATPLPGQQDASIAGDGGQQGQAGMEKRGPVEFNHAISYVNKIKNRFAAHPDIYKQFLEILQTYQRESKPIQDVYSQVTYLFKTAPDLLEDFKQFLPESAAHAKAAERERQRAEENAMLSNARGEGMYGSPITSREAQGRDMGTPSHRGNLPPVGNFAPTPVSKDHKRKRGDRQGTVGSLADRDGGVAGPSTGGKGAGGYAVQQQGQGKRMKQTHASTAAAAKGGALIGVPDQPPSSPTLIPRLPEPLPPTTTSAATSDELSFFDRAKKAIGNKNTMTEFLKLCNLFSQDFIDRTTLVHRARAFIGSNPDLMKWFIDFVGYDEKDIIIENKAREPMVPGSRISLSNCRALGPSYRLLPKRESSKLCSGRDELCNSVLNDRWASHPTWASEDSGFIAHRKNVHEEGLHRIEEERHDYDYNIEACSRTIQLLEPIAQQLRRMSNEEQMQYKLPPGLGGHSETIYKRVVMKLYGRDKGADVINQLHLYPYQVIPVLLNRLKERLETWKMAQREWEKVWREQTQKMFWKSLDHQAANSRMIDRRQFQTKTLQGEVQLRFEEQKKEERIIAGSTRGKPQVESKVTDEEVIVDATWMLLVHVEAQAATDSPRLAPWVREFVPMFFGIDQEWFEKKLREKLGETPTNGGARDDELMSGAEDSSGEKRGRKAGKATLLRQTLERGPKGRGARKDDSGSVSRASTPDVTSNAGDEAAADAIAVDSIGTPTPAEDGTTDTKSATEAPQRWFHHDIGENTRNARKVDPHELQKRHVYRLWANAPILCFVRMFTIVYERLHRLKQNESECREIVRNAKKQKPAIELGIMDKLPQDFFADTSSQANYYQQMLQKFVQVLEGELDFVNDGVEDCLRRFYLQAGYPLYPFEKMVSSLARYGGQVSGQEGGNKEKSWDIVAAWRKDRGRGDEVSAVQRADYRKGVERLIGGGESYAIDWDQVEKAVRIFLVKKDDPAYTTDGLSELDKENLWRYYIASYTSIFATDGVDQSKVSRPLLFRNLYAVGADPKSDRFLPIPVSVPESTADGQDTAQATIEAEAEEQDVGNRLLQRFLAAKNDEKLMLRISVNMYHPVFQKGSAESFIQGPREREGAGTGVREAEDDMAHRSEAMKDGFLMNNEGMKGLSKEEVEKRNEGFAKMTDGESEVKNEDGEKMEVDE